MDLYEILRVVRAGDDPFELGDRLFAAAIAKTREQLSRPILVGLCGPQGAGKSTTAKRLAERLKTQGISATICSLDDFYWSKAKRLSLARELPPLFRTRGVPGTHDVDQLLGTLDALLTDGTEPFRIRAFDKTSDDVQPQKHWPLVSIRPDVVILEGWCIGVRPQAIAALHEPVNALEASEDANGRWRTLVNLALAGPYAALFARLDLRLMLRAPSFDCICDWRMEQERRLARGPSSLGAMTPSELDRFIAHFERLTCWMMADEPADFISGLEETRVPWRWRSPKRRNDHHMMARVPL